MKGKESLERMIKILFYVCLSVTGLILLKIGTSNQFEIVMSGGTFTIKVNWHLILGMIFYIMSFIVSLILMKTMNLSFFYPVSTGLAYIGICFLSYFVLKEVISVRQLFGMSFILVGVIIMNIKR